MLRPPSNAAGPYSVHPVPAVPDFDRCSDKSRLQSTTRPPTSPSSSRLRSVLRRAESRSSETFARVPAVPDFDRCSDQDEISELIYHAESQQFPTSIGAQTARRLQARRTRRRPSSSRLRSVLRQGVVFGKLPGKTVPAVPDFDRCSDAAERHEGHTEPAVPAVPDFDRCSDNSSASAVNAHSSRSQQFPTSIGAQTPPPKPLKLHHNEGSFRAPPSTARTKRTPKGRRLLQVPFGTCFFRCRAPPGKSVLRGCSKPRAPISKIEKLPQGMTHLERWDEGLASAEQRPIADERSIPAPGRGCQPVWFKRSSDACP